MSGIFCRSLGGNSLSLHWIIRRSPFNGFCISRFEADDNAILDCSLTCFDGSEDLHNQDGKLVIITFVYDVVVVSIFGLRTKPVTRFRNFFSYTLGPENKWNIWTTPPPHFNFAKNGAILLLFAFFIALESERRLIVPFYSVQDCSWFQLLEKVGAGQ